MAPSKQSGAGTGARFSSECPSCGQERLQLSYELDELDELLRSGGEIRAYCSGCDEEWPITTEERADLSRAVTQGSTSTPRR